jgi:hypothetical protein
MKITIEHLDETFTHEFPNEQCTEVLERIIRDLLAIGFHPDSIDRSILELAFEIEGKLEHKSQEIMKETCDTK